MPRVEKSSQASKQSGRVLQQYPWCCLLHVHAVGVCLLKGNVMARKTL